MGCVCLRILLAELSAYLAKLDVLLHRDDALFLLMASVMDKHLSCQGTYLA